MTEPKSKALKRSVRSFSIMRVLLPFAIIIGLFSIYIIILRIYNAKKLEIMNAEADVSQGKLVLSYQKLLVVDLSGKKLNLLKILSTDATLGPFQRKAIEVEIIELDEKIAETEKKIEETKRKIAVAEKILK